MSDDKHGWHAIACGCDSQAETPARDPAAESLSQALRLSFRLLSVIMVVIVIAFFLTGVRSVKEHQSAIIYRFGRIVGTVDKGLCFAWPFPIGRIELVDTSVQRLDVQDFWMAETPEQRVKPLRERQPMGPGLSPEWDGALLTGDGYLIHANLKCEFRIGANAGLALQANPLIHYKRNVNELDPRDLTRTKSLLRTVICQAAIRIAGTQTAEHLRQNARQFQQDLQRTVQQRLDDLQVGLEIRSIAVQAEWPLQVMPSFDNAANEAQKSKKVIDEARANARSLLIGAAGSRFHMLVDPGPMQLTPPERRDGEPFNLIGQYLEAMDAGQDDLAAEKMAEIERVLLSAEISGRVRPIIDKAVAETNSMLDALTGRLRRFEQLLPEYRRNPEFVLQRLWAETRERILASSSVETYYFAPGSGKVILKMDRDPGTRQRIRRAVTEREQSDTEH